MALLAWLPLSLAELVQDEDGRDAKPSAFRLAALVRPPTVWPLDEAADAARTFGSARPLARAPWAWLVAHARSRVDDVHLARVRGRAARIASQLAGPELAPGASAIAARCALIEHDEEALATVAAVALGRYALSEVVAREALALHLP